MQFYILALQGRISTRACGVSYASFLLLAAGCLIEYVHVYTLHKLPGVQTMVTVQCSFAFWPGSVV